jgi:hypothetical protein
MPELKDTDPYLILQLSQLIADYGFAGVVLTLSQMQEQGLDKFPPPEPKKEANTFQEELRQALNKYGWDNSTNTPDYLLAGFLLGVLNSLNSLVRQRDKWWDFKPEIKYKEGKPLDA